LLVSHPLAGGGPATIIRSRPRAFAAPRPVELVLVRVHRMLVRLLAGWRFRNTGGPGRPPRRALGLARHDPRRRDHAPGPAAPRAELIAQDARRHFLDRALGDVAQLKWPERHADQACHLQPEMAQHVAHLAVLALADREGDPDVRGLLAVEHGLDRPIVDAVD